MAQQPLTFAVASERLRHLRGLPDTPVRRSEIAALERILASGALSRQSGQRRPGRQPRDYELESDQPDEKPVKPRKRVVQVGSHRKVIIATGTEPPPAPTDEADAADLKKEQKRRIGEIQSMLGQRFSGFD